MKENVHMNVLTAKSNCVREDGEEYNQDKKRQ